MTGRLSHRTSQTFPLSIHSSGRYLIDASSRPFLVLGDSPWSIEVQLTKAQIDTYLDTRKAQGFNAILFQTMEHKFSSQSPAEKNANGNVPFPSNTDWSSVNEAYWKQVDYVVHEAFRRNMVCFIAFAYFGFSGTDEGWSSEIASNSDAHLEAYGDFLGQRYTLGNVIWVSGGDDPGVSGAGNSRARQQLIVYASVAKSDHGIAGYRPSDIFSYHPNRGADAYSLWALDGTSVVPALASKRLNTIYTGSSAGDEATLAATAYGKSTVKPFVSIEGRYENESGGDNATLRRQIYACILSGGCGHFFGSNPVWGFGEANDNGGLGAADALTKLSTTGAGYITYARTLFDSYPWWLLVPKTDSSLVTTSLGSGTGTVCPAKASDSSFAMIWTPSVNFTVQMSALSPTSLRGRWFNPADGTYTTASGSPYSNSGTHAFTQIGDRVLVLDATPGT